MVDTRHNTLVQNHRTYTPSMNANVSYGLWVVMVRQYSFISYNKCTLWRGTLVMRVAVHAWGQRGYEKSLYLPLNVAVNLKLLPKSCLGKKSLSCSSWLLPCFSPFLHHQAFPRSDQQVWSLQSPIPLTSAI